MLKAIRIWDTCERYIALKLKYCPKIIYLLAIKMVVRPK